MVKFSRFCPDLGGPGARWGAGTRRPAGAAGEPAGGDVAAEGRQVVCTTGTTGSVASGMVLHKYYIDCTTCTGVVPAPEGLYQFCCICLKIAISIDTADHIQKKVTKRLNKG